MLNNVDQAPPIEAAPQARTHASNRLAEASLLSALFDELFPILRSITGPGIEASYDVFSRHIPFNVEKVPSGTKVFDWTVPPEWHYRGAKLIGPDGDVICDADKLNLHVVNYSEPVSGTFTLDELLPHLHSIPELPDAVPYVTSYYKENWGFCLTHRQRAALRPGKYQVEIDTSFVDGGVPFAECVLPGESEKEILLTSYLCHPSLANNELSGPLVLLSLYNRIKAWKKRRFTYRFVLNPETIGAICYLYKNGKRLRTAMVSGLVLTCLGGPSSRLRYKAARKSDALINQLLCSGGMSLSMPIETVPFNPRGGSDERQYCSPGFNLPMGQISRTTYLQYDGYHNSLDDKAFMGVDKLIESAETIEHILQYLEICGTPINLAPFCEPQLGKRDLYPNMNSNTTRRNSADDRVDGRLQLERLLTILNLADGEHTLMDIATKAQCSMDDLRSTIEKLETKGLIGYNCQRPEL